MKSLPSRWSVSCCMARLSRSSVSSSTGLPSRSKARTRIRLARRTFGVEAGEAQAAFLVLGRGMPLDDLRVDEDLLLVLLLGVGGEVQDEEPERQSDLVGGQADPPGLVHQLEHLADVRPQLVVDLLDRTGRITQCGMGVLDDLEHERHSLAIWIKPPTLHRPAR